ncbi:uncharacterized protein LOC111875710 [Cryptotermes secundus]|nr:uncharacterized protein LOC111875710 [Cryptotermes secundus]
MEVKDFWKTLIPSKYVTITKCYCVAQKPILKSSGVEIIICTVHGEVLEFSGCHIVGICEISVFDPKSITIFTTYDFKCNIFYIIESGNGIIILSRERGLKVMEEYEDVEKFMVSDFSNAGFPQLGIWTKNDKVSLTPNKIVDFKEHGSMCSDDCNISNILHEKYQELTMKVEEYEHKLQIKKQLRIHNCEVVGHRNKIPFSSGSTLVWLVGQDGPEDFEPKEHLDVVPALQIRETWQRIHNGKWVVGITICNNGERDLLDIQLILMCSSEEKITYTTKLMMYNSEEETPSPCKRPRTCNSVTTWNKVTVLKPEKKAVLIGILEAPKFVDKAIVSLSGAITYKLKQEETTEHHIPVSPFHFRVEDFSRRLGSPFTSEITEADQLCVLVTSYIVTLPVVFISNFEPSLRKLLIYELKFSEFPVIGCLFHKGTLFLELAGIMLHMETVSDLKYNLTVCARDVQQVYLLAHCMYGVLSAPHMILYPPHMQAKSLHDGLNLNLKHLQQEFRLVLEQLKQYVTGHHKSEICMSMEEYSRFRSQLSKLEMNTDTAFV